MNIIKYFTKTFGRRKREVNTRLMVMNANGFPDKCGKNRPNDRILQD